MNYNPKGIVIPNLPAQYPWWLFKDNPNERLMGFHSKIDERHVGTAKALNEIWWFELHQPLLLEMGNTTAGRELLCLDTKVDLPLIELRKNKAMFLYGHKNNGDTILVHQFYIGAKFGNVIRNRWADFKKMASSFYRIDLGRGHSVLRPVLQHNGELVAAAATDTFFPDPHEESTTCDGRTQHYHDDGAGNYVHTANTTTSEMYTDSSAATDNYLYNFSNATNRPNIARCQWHFDTSSISAASFDSSVTPTFRRYSTNQYVAYVGTSYLKSILVPNSTSSTTDVAAADFLLGSTTADAEYDAGETVASVRALSETDSNGVGEYEISLTNEGNLAALFDGSFPGIFRMSSIEANFDRPIRQGGTTTTSFYGDGNDSGVIMGQRMADHGTDSTTNDPRLTIATSTSDIHAINGIGIDDTQALNGITAANGEKINGITF